MSSARTIRCTRAANDQSCRISGLSASAIAGSSWCLHKLHCDALQAADFEHSLWHRSCSIRGMKKTLLALLLLAGGSSFAQVSIGVRIGPPPPPRVIHARPRAPGPDYFWVDGYWYPV